MLLSPFKGPSGSVPRAAGISGGLCAGCSRHGVGGWGEPPEGPGSAWSSVPRRGAGLSRVPAAQLVPELPGGATVPTLSGCPPAPQVERNQLCLRGACDRRLGWGSPWAVSACGGLREAGELTGPPPASPKLQGHLGPALSPQLWTTEQGGSCSGTLVCREQLAGVECLYFPVSRVVGHGCLGLGV